MIVVEPFFIFQHLWHSSGPVNIQLWQVINLVGGPVAAIVLLPAIVDDLERWWREWSEGAEPNRIRPR